jgi:uncharacterized protein (DUF2252 family)
LTHFSNTRQSLIRAELQRVDGIDPGADPPCAKHRKMALDPLRFLRGSAQLFYRDIAQGTLELPVALVKTPPLTAIMGDCHVSNFGFITEQGSPGQRVVFCPNDFDDACIGPAVWDLARFIVSLLLAADYTRGLLSGDYDSEYLAATAKLRAASPVDALRAASGFLRAYRHTCRQSVDDPHGQMRALEHFRPKHVLGRFFRQARRRAAGGRDFTTRSTLGKEVEIDRGRPRFRDRPERFAPLDPERAAAVRHAFRPFVDDCILDLVQRLEAGTGSANLERFYLLVGPEDFSGYDDLPLCHVVEIKQQRPAAALFHFPDISPVNRLNPAHLTVDCQRLMQRSPDLVLDEALWEGKHWLVRSRHHARVGIKPEDIALAAKNPGSRLAQYAAACGGALALAHARGDRRSTRFEASMAEQLEPHAAALISAARGYAKRVSNDRRLLSEMLAFQGQYPH